MRELSNQFAPVTDVVISPDVSSLQAEVTFTATVLNSTTSAQLEQVYEAIVSAAFDGDFGSYDVDENSISLESVQSTFRGKKDEVLLTPPAPLLIDFHAVTVNNVLDTGPVSRKTLNTFKKCM